MLASRFLTTTESNFIVFRWFEAMFKRTEYGYRASLTWCMGRRALMLMVSAADCAAVETTRIILSVTRIRLRALILS